MTSAQRSFQPRSVPSVVPILNPLMRRIVGVGLPTGPNVLLTVRGRTSGKPHTFPVAIMEHDGHRYVQGTFGETQWVRNLRVAGEATIAKGRRREDVRAVEVAPDEAAQMMAAVIGPYMRRRVGRALVRWLFGVGPDTSPDDLVAMAREHPTFELLPR